MKKIKFILFSPKNILFSRRGNNYSTDLGVIYFFFKAKWEKIWEEEAEVEKLKKDSWTERMLCVPEFMRKNSNLYLSGPRMLKSARYADAVYDKMLDAGTILQRQGKWALTLGII